MENRQGVPPQLIDIAGHVRQRFVSVDFSKARLNEDGTYTVPDAEGKDVVTILPPVEGGNPGWRWKAIT